MWNRTVSYLVTYKGGEVESSLSLLLFRATLKVSRLKFVTTLGKDNFECNKMNAHFKKFTACLREGLIEASFTSGSKHY